MRPMMLGFPRFPLASLIMLMSPQWCGHSHVHTTGGRRRCVQPAGSGRCVQFWAAAGGLRTSFYTRNHRLLATVIPFSQACKCLLCVWGLPGLLLLPALALCHFVHGPAALVLPCVLQPHQLSLGRAGEASVVVQFPLALRRLVGRSLL